MGIVVLLRVLIECTERIVRLLLVLQGHSEGVLGMLEGRLGGLIDGLERDLASSLILIVDELEGEFPLLVRELHEELQSIGKGHIVSIVVASSIQIRVREMECTRDLSIDSVLGELVVVVTNETHPSQSECGLNGDGLGLTPSPLPPSPSLWLIRSSLIRENTRLPLREL
ncbi:hypothetical protein PENTCL1PPCAC_26194, partial [Pristionchus entomophagus]